MMITKETNFGYIYIVTRDDRELDTIINSINLSECEKSYLDNISSELRKREWLTSRCVIRKVLGDDVSTYYDDRRPLLKGSDKHLSISHSDDVVVVMLSDKQCGVDIEGVERNFSRVRGRFMSLSEQSMITPENSVYAWSIKEAAYKAIGVHDIIFNSMFIINSIDYINGVAVMTYKDRDYSFNFFIHNKYVISYIER